LTPNTVVDLVNQGRMSVEAGDAAMKALALPRLKTCRQATFAVRIAMQVPGDTDDDFVVDVVPARTQPPLLATEAKGDLLIRRRPTRARRPRAGSPPARPR
jgi:hypothetical protein